MIESYLCGMAPITIIREGNKGKIKFDYVKIEQLDKK